MVAAEQICRFERNTLLEELQWVSQEPEVSKLRALHGADMVLFVIGTSKYGGQSLAIHTFEQPERRQTFAVIEYSTLAGGGGLSLSEITSSQPAAAEPAAAAVVARTAAAAESTKKDVRIKELESEVERLKTVLSAFLR